VTVETRHELMERAKRGARAGREVRKLREAHPLAFMELWRPTCNACAEDGDAHEMECPDDLSPRHTCPECGAVELRTCQRCAVHAGMLPDVLIVMLLGGNRSGKSAAKAQIDAAYTLGADDPAVQRWCRINGLPIEAIQRGPGVTYSVALTGNDSIRYVRPKVKACLPPEWKWRGEYGDSEATVFRPGWRLGQPGICYFKMSRQGRTAIQGDACHHIGIDEEPVYDASGILDEALQRLLDYNGRLWFAMTPLMGWTPLLERLARNPDPDVVIRYLSVLDNPWINRADALRRLAKFGAHVRAAREGGQITALEGRVHEEWDRGLHVVPAFDPPADWDHYGSIDFGVRNPFAHIWAAVDPGDDVIHVFRAHYKAEATLRTHADAIWAVELCPDCRSLDPVGSDPWWEWRTLADEDRSPGADGKPCKACAGSGRRMPVLRKRYADPEGLDSRKTLASEYGLHTQPAKKARREGFDALFARTNPDAEGRPHIVFHDHPSMAPVIEEFENLTWKRDDVQGKTVREELATQGADHAHDTVRYLCLGLQRRGFAVG